MLLVFPPNKKWGSRVSFFGGATMEPPRVIGDFPVPPSGLGFFSGFHPLWTAQRPIGSRFKLEVGEVPTVATNKHTRQTWLIIACKSSSKANRPSFLKSSGIVMLFKELQPQKALCPMAITDSGILMLSKDLQSVKV